MSSPVYPDLWFWIILDTDPDTKVWESATGTEVDNSGYAAYEQWLVDISADTIFGPLGIAARVVGAVDNGSGLIRLSVEYLQSGSFAAGVPATWATGDRKTVASVGGVAAATGSWIITVVDATLGWVDLQGSTMSGTFSSNGAIGAASSVATFDGLMRTIADLAITRAASRTGIDTHSSSATLDDTAKFIQTMSTSGPSQALTLPLANLPTSFPIGFPIYFHNPAALSWDIKYPSGSVLATVYTGDWLVVVPISNVSSDGLFITQVLRSYDASTGSTIPSSNFLFGVQLQVALSANQDDYNPAGLGRANVLQFTTDASRNLTGIVPGSSAQMLLLINEGSNPLVLKNDTTSSAANRFDFGTDITINSKESLFIYYDSYNTRWKCAGSMATKAYVDALIAANDAMVFKGVIDCSANPNYPAASRGDTYRVSVAGKIGGASGTNVEAGDLLICLTDGTASGTQAGVGSSWTIAQTNIDGAVVGPASATDGDVARFDGTTGKLIKAGISLDTDGTLAANSDTRVPSQKAVKTYADGLITAIKNGVSSAFDTLAEIATELALKAYIASPTFTGTPAAPTAAVNTNTTQIATTAFVLGQTQTYRVAANFSKTSSTSLSAVTGLAAALAAGKVYEFEVWLFTTAGASGGVQASIDTSDTLTATNIAYEGVAIGSNQFVGEARGAALATVFGSGLFTSVVLWAKGLIEVNAAGTLVVKFAQNTSNGTASNVLRGSFMTVRAVA